MGFIFKGILAVIWLLVVPCLAGGFYFRREKRTCSEYLLAGYTLLFAITELLSLTMIFTKQPLHVLTVTYGVVAGVLAFLGARSFYKKRQKNGISPELVVAGILILIQLVVVVLYAHMDEDDAFYVGTATTAVETDTLYAYNPYTGAAYNVLPSRYILSPFPAFLAVTSRLCGGLHPAIVAHTVFPAVFVFLAYVVLFQYSRIFFRGKAGEQGIFMILCAVILWFCGYSVYNSEIFTMGRIWQGKAVLAGVFLPFLFLLCMEIFMQEKPEYPWSLAFLANGACCLFSSMGIMLAPLLMGVFALFSLVKFRNGRRFLKSVVCCLPSLILGEMKRALLASLDAWQKYWGNGFYVYLLLAACLYFLVFGRKKERSRILSGYIVVFLAVFFCPVTAYIIQKCIGRSVYWRVLWILPAVPLIAYAGTCLIKKVGASRPRQYILLIFIAAVLAFCGTGLNKDGFYKKVQNVQKIPDEVVSICNLINEQKEENEEIYLATDDKIASYVRVYDPSIKMPYGRGGKGASGKKAARWLHKQLVAEVPVIKKVVKNAKRLKCNYLVFPVPSKKKQLYMETKGFYLIGQVNEYGIFKYYE